MTFIMEKDEGTAARRRVPFRVFTSDGTSPETGLSDGTALHSVNGGAQVVSNNSISAISTAAGLYYVEFDASEIATLGSYAIYTDAVGADFSQHVANVQVVNSNPMSTESHGAYLQPTTAGRTLDVTAGGTAGIDWANVEAPTTEINFSGTTVVGVTRADTVTQTVSADAIQISGDAGAANNLEAAFDGTGYDSSLTVLGVSGRVDSNVTIAPATYSDVTVRLEDGITYSDVTITGVQRADVVYISGDDTAANNLEAAFDGTGYDSSLTVIGVSGRVDSNVTIADADYSAVTVRVDSSVTIAGVTNVSTEIAAVQADTDDIQTRLPAALVGGRMDSNVGAISTDATAADNLEAAFDGTGYDSNLTVLGVSGRVDSSVTIANATYSGVTVRLETGVAYSDVTITGVQRADVAYISGDATAADNLEGMMDGIIVAQVNDGSATATDFAADGFTEATDDHFNGRLITFISGALVGQQTDITDYDAAGGAQGNQQFTVTALTEPPANNDFFVIH